MDPPIPKDRLKFRIAIICVLEEEFNAIAGALDIDFQRYPYEKDYGKVETDKNTYKNGRIGKHDVVIVKLPGTGKEPAASTASSIFMSYEKIALALVVGVCAGSPNDEKGNEIILGDVLISTHVYQHDHARLLEGGMAAYETPAHTLGRAPKEIRSFVGTYSTAYEKEDLEEHVAGLVKKLLDKSFLRTYVYPGRENDRLFPPGYHHRHPQAAECLQCQKDPTECQQAEDVRNLECTKLGCNVTELTSRKRLQCPDNCSGRHLPQSGPPPTPALAPKPLIHFGNFASGDQVIRSSSYRDSLRDRYKVIGFEMEGAGVWDNIPTVIIKGVCDYADSHKNKLFQGYAAVTAAACMKVLLQRWHIVDSSLPASATTAGSESARAEELPVVLKWISEMIFTGTYQNNIDKMQEGSGKWILDEPNFCAWARGELRTLWLHGMPGAGKTVLVSSIIQHLKSQKFENSATVFIYFQRKNNAHKPKALIASILRQMVQQGSDISDEVWSSYKLHRLEGTELSEIDCRTLLQGEVARFDQVYITIDAIDEGEEQNVLELLEMLGTLQNNAANINVLVSCRHANFFQDRLLDPVEIEILAKGDDIRLFLNARLKVKPALQRLIARHPNLKSTIIEAITDKIQGMFLLAELLVELLESRRPRSKKDLLSLLNNMPSVLDETYKELWQQVLEQVSSDVELAKMVFSSVSYAREQLTVQALRHILWAWSTDTHDSIDEDDLLEEDQFLPVCLGLIQSNDNTITFVHYTAEMFFPRHLSSYFPSIENDMTVACIRYLSLPCFQASGLGSWTTEEDQDNFGFLGYAARNWGHHAKKSPQDLIRNTVYQFLELSQDFNRMANVLLRHQQIQNARSKRDTNDYLNGIINLHLVAYFGLNWATLHLLNSKVSIDSQDCNGWNALRWAAFGRQHQTVLLLAEKGSNIDQKDTRGMTTLHWLLGLNDVFVRIHDMSIYGDGGVVAFYETYLSSDPQDSRRGANASVLWSTSIDTISILIQKSGDIDTTNFKGRSALSLAAQNQQWELVNHLLTRGADVDLTDSQGMTPLIWALQYPRTYKEYSDINIYGDCMVQLGTLLVLDPTIETNNDQTDISIAQRDKYITSLVGKKLDARDPNGRSALSLAAESGLKTLVEHLLEKGADVNSTDVNNKTPIMWAMTRRPANSLRVNRLRVYGSAKVFIGTILEAYCDSIADFTIRPYTFFDETRMQIINCLVDSFANLDIQGSDGQTPLDLAVSQGLSDLEILFRERLGLELMEDEGRDPWRVRTPEGKMFREFNNNITSGKSIMVCLDMVGYGAGDIAKFNKEDTYVTEVEVFGESEVMIGNVTSVHGRRKANSAPLKSVFIEKWLNEGLLKVVEDGNFDFVM